MAAPIFRPSVSMTGIVEPSPIPKSDALARSAPTFGGSREAVHRGRRTIRNRTMSLQSALSHLERVLSQGPPRTLQFARSLVLEHRWLIRSKPGTDPDLPRSEFQLRHRTLCLSDSRRGRLRGTGPASRRPSLRPCKRTPASGSCGAYRKERCRPAQLLL